MPTPTRERPPTSRTCRPRPNGPRNRETPKARCGRSRGRPDRVRGSGRARMPSSCSWLSPCSASACGRSDGSPASVPHDRSGPSPPQSIGREPPARAIRCEVVSEAAEFEPYVTTRRLEAGATSELYEARHQSLDRVVWLKVLRPHVPLSSPFAARLSREGQFLARLAHPNVQSILDSVRRPPRLWLVLEAVDGWTLSDVLAELHRSRPGAGFDMRGAVALVLQIARGLAH